MRRLPGCSRRSKTVPRAEGSGDPLAGVRVVAFEQAVALPFATFALAEMGAEVIKIERPGAGDVLRGWDHAVRGLSTGFVWVNAGKRDIALDVGTNEGREIARLLAARADVFAENFSPGVADRLGLGYQDLSADHPGLVYCSVSGFGHDGPYRAADGRYVTLVVASARDWERFVTVVARREDWRALMVAKRA